MILQGMLDYSYGFWDLEREDHFYEVFVINQEEHLRREDPTQI